MVEGLACRLCIISSYSCFLVALVLWTLMLQLVELVLLSEIGLSSHFMSLSYRLRSTTFGLSSLRRSCQQMCSKVILYISRNT